METTMETQTQTQTHLHYEGAIFDLAEARVFESTMTFSTSDPLLTRAILTLKITQSRVRVSIKTDGETHNHLAVVTEAQMFSGGNKTDATIKCLCQLHFLSSQEQAQAQQQQVEINAVGQVKLAELVERTRSVLVEELNLEYDQLKRYDSIICGCAMQLFEAEQASARMVGAIIDGTVMLCQTHDAIETALWEALMNNPDDYVDVFAQAENNIATTRQEDTKKMMLDIVNAMKPRFEAWRKSNIVEAK